MNIILELPIDNFYSIVVVSRYDTDLNIMYGYSGELFIALKHYENTYLKLSSTVTLWDLESILDHFCAVSNYKISMPLGIDNPQQLGLSYNSYWDQVSSHPDEEFSEWIGAPMKLLECNGVGLKSCLTFLYNGGNHDIELLITTKYPWFFSLKKAPMLYKTWLKHYKVLYNFNISQVVMQDWIQKLQVVCEILRKNVDEMYSSST